MDFCRTRLNVTGNPKYFDRLVKCLAPKGYVDFEQVCPVQGLISSSHGEISKYALTLALIETEKNDPECFECIFSPNVLGKVDFLQYDKELLDKKDVNGIFAKFPNMSQEEIRRIGAEELENLCFSFGFSNLQNEHRFYWDNENNAYDTVIWKCPVRGLRDMITFSSERYPRKIIERIAQVFKHCIFEVEYVEVTGDKDPEISAIRREEFIAGKRTGNCQSYDLVNDKRDCLDMIKEMGEGAVMPYPLQIPVIEARIAQMEKSRASGLSSQTSGFAESSH